MGTKDQLSQDCNELGSLKEEIAGAEAKRDDWESRYIDCWETLEYVQENVARARPSGPRKVLNG